MSHSMIILLSLNCSMYWLRIWKVDLSQHMWQFISTAKVDFEKYMCYNSGHKWWLLIKISISGSWAPFLLWIRHRPVKLSSFRFSRVKDCLSRPLTLNHSSICTLIWHFMASHSDGSNSDDTWLFRDGTTIKKITPTNVTAGKQEVRRGWNNRWGDRYSR